MAKQKKTIIEIRTRQTSTNPIKLREMVLFEEVEGYTTSYGIADLEDGIVMSKRYCKDKAEAEKEFATLEAAQ